MKRHLWLLLAALLLCSVPAFAQDGAGTHTGIDCATWTNPVTFKSFCGKTDGTWNVWSGSAWVPTTTLSPPGPLPSYTVAAGANQFPATCIDNQLASASDNIRGVWKCTGNAWHSITGVANIIDFGADPSGAVASTTAVQAAFDTVSALGEGTVFAPDGTYLIGAVTLRAGVNLVGQSQQATIFQGDGDLFTLSVDPSRLMLKNLTIRNVSTRGKLLTANYASGMNEMRFENVTFGKAAYHIYMTTTITAWKWVNCQFQDANVISRYLASSWVASEYGTYAWYNAQALYLGSGVAGSATFSSYASVYELNTDSPVVINGDTTGEIDGISFIGAHFERNATTTLAADIQILTSAVTRVRAVSFINTTIVTPTAGQTVRVSLVGGGGGNINNIYFEGCDIGGAVPLTTASATVTFGPGMYFQSGSGYPATYTAVMTVPNTLDRYLGTSFTVGTELGNSGVMASVTPPASAVWADVKVQGNIYHNAANTHDGYLTGAWVASGNRVHTITDVNNTSGSAQGFVLSWTGTQIQVANKSGISYTQSGDVIIVFWGQ
jgi:hypothetical protein